MSELQHLLRANHVNSFESAKLLLNEEPYCLNIRYSDDLYRFHYTDKSDKTNPVVKECAGIVLEMSTNEIVSYGMNAFEDEKINPVPSGTLITRSIDGTLIRLFHREGVWHISTTKSIDAGQAYWSSNKNFKELFLEACEKTTFDWTELNVDYTYSFVLQHPECRNVSPIDSGMRIIHVATRDLCTLKEVPIFGKECLYSVTRPAILDIDNFEEDEEKVPWEIQGYVMQTPDFRRYKFKNPAWLEVQELKGNHPDMVLRFIELVREETSSSWFRFSECFPEYESGFNRTVSLYIDLPIILYGKFKYYFIERRGKLTNSEPMYHGLMSLYVRFKQSGGNEPTTLEVVKDYVENCSVEDIAKLIN